MNNHETQFCHASQLLVAAEIDPSAFVQQGHLSDKHAQTSNMTAFSCLMASLAACAAM